MSAIASPVASRAASISQPRSEFLMDIGGGKSLTAVISHARAEELGLREGDQAAAHFAPENVILAIA